jgi:hypothetical protein
MKKLGMMTLAGLLAFAGTAAAQTKTLTGDEVTVTATVEAIDAQNRILTLKSPDGTYEMVYAPPEMKRFAELKVGDKVTRTLLRQHRDFDSRSRVKRPSILDTASVTPGTGKRPGGTAATQRTITATIVGIDPKVPSILADRPQWLEIQLPRGRQEGSEHGEGRRQTGHHVDRSAPDLGGHPEVGLRYSLLLRNISSPRRIEVKRLLFAVALSAALGIVTFQAQGQNAPARGQGPAPSADPYANNPDAGKQAFPLAAPAGKDSGAKQTPPAGAANTGPFDVAGWKYGPQFRPPGDGKLWNPVMVKLKAGGKVTGGTVFSSTDPLTYCAMANAGYDFIWTEMQHNDPRLEPGRAHVANLPARQRPFPECASLILTNARFSTRPTPGAGHRRVRRSTPSKRRPKLATGHTSAAGSAQQRRWTGFDGAMWGNVPGSYPCHGQRQHRPDSDDRDP